MSRAPRPSVRGIKVPVRKDPPGLKKVAGPFQGTLQAGPARPTRAHGLSDEHQDRGLLYCEKAIWEDAIKEFQKSVDLTPEFSEGWNNLGVCYLYTNRLDNAIGAFNEAIRHFPGWHIALSNLGLALQRSKKLDPAINYYKQSVTKHKNQPQVWVALAEAHESSGKIEDATEALRTALSLAPKYDIALYRLGMILAKRMELDEAETVLKTALDQDPTLADAAGVLGAIAARRGDIGAARVYYEQAKTARPEKVPPTAAKGLSALDTYEQGIRRNFEEMQTIYTDLPSIAECQFNVGLVYLKEQNYSMARTSFQAAIEADPNWAEPLIWLGMVEAIDKNPGVARQHWDAARNLEGGDSGVVCESLGLAALAMGLSKEADKYFDEARKQGRAVPMAGSSSRLPAQTDSGN